MQKSSTNYTKYKHFAFISYRWADEKWAKWLQNKIESYSLPTAIYKKNKDLHRKLKPCFRDKTDLGIGELTPELQENLRNSKFLIVICSPNSAKSTWVGAEIEYFISLGRKDSIIPFIIDGIPYNNDEKDCLHPVIKKYFPQKDEDGKSREILGANINEEGKGSRWIKKEKAAIKVIAKMHSLAFDELWQREKRRNRQKMFYTLFICFAMGFLIGYISVKNQPKTVSFSLNETSFHNKNLPPLKDGRITLYLENEKKDTIIKSLKDEAIFHNIPAKFLSKKVRVTFSTTENSYKENDYLSTEETIVLKENNIINIQRNDSVYGYFYLELEDFTSGKLLKNTTVYIDDMEFQTNEDGILNCIIPIEKQKTLYQLKKVGCSIPNSVQATYNTIGQFKQIK
ncbi:MAG: toll/interleukin-1 receptor domain-containing protein [Bacteroidales bacterium]|nr:toll/interleukin-1 receptor domain-containing protein [Bacteroidales bacterium]